MNDTETKADVKIIVDAAELENVLGELEIALEKQVKLLADEDFDEFISFGENVAEKLNHVSNAQAPLTWKCFDRIRQIHGLHHSLGLTLATKSEEMAQNLTKMRSGRNVLKAYKAGG